MRARILLSILFVLTSCSRDNERQVIQAKINVDNYNKSAKVAEEAILYSATDTTNAIKAYAAWVAQINAAVICRDSFQVYSDKENYDKWSHVVDSLTDPGEFIAIPPSKLP